MGVESLADVLFAGFDVRLTRVTKAAEGLVVEAVACGPPPRCPGCNSQATRVHSSYERGLAGLPVNGRRAQALCSTRRRYLLRSHVPVSPGCFVSTTHARAHRAGGGPEGYLRRQGRGRRGAVRGSAGLRVDPGAGRDLQP